MDYKGFIITTKKEYKIQSRKCAKLYNVDSYAGGRRNKNGKCVIDIILKNGNFFIKDDINGTDTITDNELNLETEQN